MTPSCSCTDIEFLPPVGRLALSPASKNNTHGKQTRGTTRRTLRTEENRIEQLLQYDLVRYHATFSFKGAQNIDHLRTWSQRSFAQGGGGGSRATLSALTKVEWTVALSDLAEDGAVGRVPREVEAFPAPENHKTAPQTARKTGETEREKEAYRLSCKYDGTSRDGGRYNRVWIRAQASAATRFSSPL